MNIILYKSQNYLQRKNHKIFLYHYFKNTIITLFKMPIIHNIITFSFRLE